MNIIKVNRSSNNIKKRIWFNFYDFQVVQRDSLALFKKYISQDAAYTIEADHNLIQETISKLLHAKYQKIVDIKNLFLR